MIRIRNVRVEINDTLSYEKRISTLLNIRSNQIMDVKLVKKSLDARRKNDIHYICTFDFNIDVDEQLFIAKHKKQGLDIVEDKIYEIPQVETKKRVVVVGSGPAGLFTTLLLARAGVKPTLIERGTDVDTRTQDINEFWKGNSLKLNSNVQFGEGGAGTFSDGKLNSGIKDSRCQFVLETFHDFGAPEEIIYNSKPHIGTDYLKIVVKNMREEINRLGGKVLFNHQLTNIRIDNNVIKAIEITVDDYVYEEDVDALVMAIGHSARDTFVMLKDLGFEMVAKNFAMGVRIEHPQDLINVLQYGKFRDKLPAADYKLAVHLENGRDLYTFCMCPGGEVVNATNLDGHIVTNGMSYFDRDKENANSALLVGISPSDLESDDPLAGMNLQIELEQRAYQISDSYLAPVQLVDDFLKGQVSTEYRSVKPTYKPGCVFTDFNTWLPKYMVETLKDGLVKMDMKMPGFNFGDALLVGVESRSSSPVRILRDSDMEASIKGVYPIGEGAGYAGGIMSSAVDGIKCFEKLVEKLR